mmetsp:Transcript_42161/g.109332  ORF Transcript_42161/g.109332 Transcript_42161/m.109332 type:complete len:300 (+) Transcript_42161:3-902(+)
MKKSKNDGTPPARPITTQATLLSGSLSDLQHTGNIAIAQHFTSPILESDLISVIAQACPGEWIGYPGDASLQSGRRGVVRAVDAIPEVAAPSRGFLPFSARESITSDSTVCRPTDFSLVPNCEYASHSIPVAMEEESQSGWHLNGRREQQSDRPLVRTSHQPEESRLVRALPDEPQREWSEHSARDSQHETRVSDDATRKPVAGSRNKRLRHGAPQGMCRVDSCKAPLEDASKYSRRRKYCSSCMRLGSVVYDGVESRYCQQCSTIHQLADFNGNNRSCRKSLLRRNNKLRLTGSKPHR